MFEPVTLEMLESMIKEVDAMEAGFVSNPSLRQRQWFVVRVEEVNWLFNPSLSRLCLAVEAEKADWSFKPSFKWLLCFLVVVASLVFCRFYILSTWEL